MKRTLYLILAVVLLSAFCCTAYASTVYSFGDWAAEAAADGAGYAVTSCSSASARITVPQAFDSKPVLAVSPHAFLKNSTMQTLTVREPVHTIGEYACLDCTALTAVTLPQTLTSIGEGAFSGDSRLSQINLNKTCVTAIEPYTFADTALSELTLPASCTRIADNAFLNCASLSSLTIPKEVNEIGESAFIGCDQLTILCREGSFAAQYAASHSIPYRYVTSVYPYLVGDANGDGMVSVLDATRIQRQLALMTVEDSEGVILRGDIDGDGLKIFDATSIQRYLVGLGNPHGINVMIYG